MGDSSYPPASVRETPAPVPTRSLPHPTSRLVAAKHPVGKTHGIHTEGSEAGGGVGLPRPFSDQKGRGPRESPDLGSSHAKP